MEWYYYLIIIVVTLGAGIGMGIGFERLGQWNYFRKLTTVNTTANTRIRKFSEMSDLNKNVDVLFLGDSITELYLTEDYYYGLKTVNRGISGDTSKGILNRFDTDVIALNPKKIFLLIGTNDLGNSVKPAEIMANIKKMDELLRAKCPETEFFIESVYPVSKHLDAISNIHNLRNNKYINELNALLIDYCQSAGRKYIDLAPLLCDKDGYISDQNSGDGLHLEHPGYQIVTAEIKKYI